MSEPLESPRQPHNNYVGGGKVKSKFNSGKAIVITVLAVFALALLFLSLS